MGLFEEQPWLLVPFVLIVVVGYDIAKWGVRRLLDRGEQTPIRR